MTSHVVSLVNEMFAGSILCSLVLILLQQHANARILFFSGEFQNSERASKM